MNMSIAENILKQFPSGIPMSEVLNTLSAVMAATIIQAADGDFHQESLYLSTVQSDLAFKVNGGTV